MRKIFLLSGWLLATGLDAQTTPLVPFDAPSIFSGTTTVQGPFDIFSPYMGMGPVVIYNTAKVDFIAGERIHLQPGFVAGNFSGDGYFHAQIGATPDFDVVFIEPNSAYPQVGQFEKLEMGVRLPATLEQQVDQFFSSGYASGINPFNPELISLEATFTKGSESYLICGFYYREYIRHPDSVAAHPDIFESHGCAWIDQNTEYDWRIRWAPPTMGAWNCAINIRIGNNITPMYNVSGIQFNCIPSSNKGWVEKGQSNWNLRFSGTHDSYFALGQNIAWCESFFRGHYFRDVAPAFMLYKGGYLDVLDWTENLANSGGNMVRVVSRPATYDFEWENLNNYDKGMPRAWELDQLFKVCENNNLKLFYCFQYHPCFNVNNSDEADWDLNPYNLELPGIDMPDDFLNDEDAHEIYKLKLRYFLARWGYSTSLGVFELLSEMDGWTYADEDNFRSNADAQIAQRLWHDIMLEYAKSQTPYRPLLTSSCYAINTPARAIEFPIFDSEEVDITTYHAYESERDVNNMRLREFQSFWLGEGTHDLWPDKPTVFDEMGINNSGADPDDVEACSDISYHNSLWATSMMGGIGTGLQWWQWSNNSHREANFPSLNSYFDGLNFETKSFKSPSFWDDAPTSSFFHEESFIEVFYNVSESRDEVIGWVHNTTYWWGNMNDECYDRSANQMVVSSDVHDDLHSNPVPWMFPADFQVDGLNNLATYTVDFWRTRNPGGVHSSMTMASNIFGVLKPEAPEALNPDCAFKAYRPGDNFRITTISQTNDTVCYGDTIYAKGNHEFDTLNMFQYHWNFGNGESSQLKNCSVYYNAPGDYLVTLVVSDSSIGWSDTLKQIIVVEDCQSVSRRNLTVIPEHSSRIFPNPANDIVNLYFDTCQTAKVVTISSLDGRICWIGTVIGTSTAINVNEWEQGLYVVWIRDAIHKEVLQLIILK